MNEDIEYISCRYGDISKIKEENLNDIMKNSIIDCISENLYFAFQMYESNQSIISKDDIINIVNENDYKAKCIYNDEVLNNSLWDIEYTEEIKEYDYNTIKLYI